jgi:hypothetical protein
MVSRTRHAVIGLVALAVGLGATTLGVGAAAGAEPLVVTDDVPDTVQVQYSDAPVLTFSATSDAGAVQATPAGLPTGLVLTRTPASDPGTSPSEASWSVTGAATGPLGDHPVTFTVTDGTSTPQVVATTIRVVAEDATATYTGDRTAEAPRTGNDAVPVRLSAHVSAAADGTPGDVTAATVTFTDPIARETLCAGLPVTAAGNASCVIGADLPDDASRYYAITVTVGGRYAGSGSGALAVSVDKTAPQTSITAGPAHGSLLLGTSTSFGFGSSEAPATFVCLLDGAARSCPSSPLGLSGLSEGTHTFSVRAADQMGNRDATPAMRTFTVPLDDLDLTVAKGVWQRKRSGAAWFGSYLQSKQKGATLSYPVRGARSVSLLVGRGAKYGAVRVLLDGKLLRTVSLKGPAGLRQVVPVASFGTPRSGTVTIVSRNKKVVQVDGLAVVTG